MNSVSATKTSPVNLGTHLFVLLAIVLAVPLVGGRLASLAGDLMIIGTGNAAANSDFINYWMAPRLALAGDLDLLSDQEGYMSLLREMFGPAYPDHAWSYPPHAILLLLPLAAFSYETAMIVFLSVTLALYVLAAEAFRRRYAPDADRPLFWSAHLPFLLFNIAATQNGFLTGALLLGFLAFTGRRHFLAGLMLALLTIKPQLGLFIPLFLVCRRQWGEILWAGLLATVLCALFVILFGFQPWKTFFEVTLPQQDEVMRTWSGGMLLMMPTVIAGLRLIGFESGNALIMQAGFSLACLPLAVLAIWRAPSELERALALTLSTALVLPYSFAYDMGALVSVAAALLACRRFSRKSAWLAALCLMPLAVLAFGFSGVPAGPLVLLASLIYLCLAGPAVSRSGGELRSIAVAD